MSRLPDYAALKHLKALSREDKTAISNLIRVTATAARRDELRQAELAFMRGDLRPEDMATYFCERFNALRAGEFAS